MKTVTRSMSWLLLSLFILLGTHTAAQGPPPQPGDPEMKLPPLLAAKPLKEDPRDDELRKLQKARYNEAIGELKSLYKLYKDYKIQAEPFAEAGPRLLQAGLDLYDKPADKVALLTQYLDFTKEIEKGIQLRYEAGTVDATQFHRTRYMRLDAEIHLLRAKRAVDKAKAK